MAVLQTSLQRFPAVLIIGARQVGKSTLVQQLLEDQLIDQYATLDDLTTLTLARQDPDIFVQNYTTSVAIDEIQRAPDLMRALKKSIDIARKPGRFLLTSSANILAYKEVTESLAGRMDIIHLEGLSLHERLQANTSCELVKHLLFDMTQDELLNHLKSASKQLPILTKKDWLHQIMLGGYPPVALTNNLEFATRWFAAYETTYIEKDVRDLSKLIDIIPYRQLFHLCGLRTGNLLNALNLAMDVGIDQRTIARYLGFLELTFQINRLQPWHSNANKRLIKSPKVYVNDSAFACFLQGITTQEQLERSLHIGALLETWVWAELRKQMYLLPGVSAYFFRTYQGKEVDFILTQGTRQCGIEVKWTSFLEPRDFLGLQEWQSLFATPPLGIILYAGEEIMLFGERLIAVPLKCLI